MSFINCPSFKNRMCLKMLVSVLEIETNMSSSSIENQSFRSFFSEKSAYLDLVSFVHALLRFFCKIFALISDDKVFPRILNNPIVHTHFVPFFLKWFSLDILGVLHHPQRFGFHHKCLIGVQTNSNLCMCFFCYFYKQIKQQMKEMIWWWFSQLFFKINVLSGHTHN